MPPAVSVLLPVFNAAATLARAARSILDGTFDDVELLILDDGSTDGSAEVAEELNDPRVGVHRFAHRGLVATLNDGVRLARGPRIARMDADDVAMPDRLAAQVEVEADVVGSQVRIVDEAGNLVSSMQRYQQWINEHVDHASIAAMRFVESPLVHPTVLAKRAVFELGYRDGDFPEDYDLWLRAIAAGFHVKKVAQPLLDWHESASRLTRTDKRYSPEAFDRCRRMHLLEGPLRSVKTVDLWGAGQTGKPWLRWLQAQGIAVRYVYDINPRQIGERIHGVRVLHPDDMPQADGVRLIIAVGAAGARELIAAHIAVRDFVTGHDAWFVA